MRRAPLTLLALLLLAAPLVAIHFVMAATTAEPSPKSPIGKQIAAFELHDYLGAVHRLDQWSDKKAIVVIFLGTECPIARLAGPRLAELAARYEEKGVVFVGINSNSQDSLADIAHYAKEHKITVSDSEGCRQHGGRSIRRRADARRLRARRRSRVRYRGMIDNQYGVGYARPTATSNYMLDALDEVLAGKAVTAADDRAGRMLHRPGASGRPRQQGDFHQGHRADLQRALRHLPSNRGRSPRSRSRPTMRPSAGPKRSPRWSAAGGCLPGMPVPTMVIFATTPGCRSSEKDLIYAWAEAGCPQGKPAERAAAAQVRRRLADRRRPIWF